MESKAPTGRPLQTRRKGSCLLDAEAQEHNEERRLPSILRSVLLKDVSISSSDRRRTSPVLQQGRHLRTAVRYRGRDIAHHRRRSEASRGTDRCHAGCIPGPPRSRIIPMCMALFPVVGCRRIEVGGWRVSQVSSFQCAYSRACSGDASSKS